jgi:transcriptional regulator with XRE-family HTH domain
VSVTEMLAPSRLAASDTQFARPHLLPDIEVDERVRTQDDDLSGVAELVYRERLGAGERDLWWRPAGSDRIFFIPDEVLQQPTLSLGISADETWLLNAPQLESLRETIQSRLELLARQAADTLVHLQQLQSGVVVLDVPTQLQEARLQAGLPVQDVAAMFGVKRRQYYNLMNGDSPSLDTERRIGPVSEAIRRIASAAGNPRTTRSAILARIEGDSVFDAATSGDTERLELATTRAVDVIESGQPLRKRLPPSLRATPEAAAAAREELRSSRDQMGFSGGGS